LLAPEWDANGNNAIIDRTPEGSPIYINLDSVIPQNGFISTKNALLRDDISIDEALIEGISEFFEPFTSEDIFKGKVIDLLRNNKKGTNSPVYDPNDTPKEKGKDMAAHLAEVLVPGGQTFKAADRFLRGMRGQSTNSGIGINTKAELIKNFTGVRTTALDQEFTIKGVAHTFSNGTSRATRRFSRVAKQRGPLSDKDARDGFEDMLRLREIAGKKTLKRIDALKIWYHDDDIKRFLKEAKISKDNIKLLMDGKLPEFKLGSRLQKDIDKVDGRKEQLKRLFPELKFGKTGGKPKSSGTVR